MLTKMQRVFLVLAAIFYIGAGINHFVHPVFYLKIMPPYIPWHLAMVQISGVAEVAGGVGLLIPSMRRAAAWGLVALLIAVFPANVYAAMNFTPMPEHPWAYYAVWLRLPFQLVPIYWVLWCTKERRAV
jgi:uncharacterized membrane protein